MPSSIRKEIFACPQSAQAAALRVVDSHGFAIIEAHPHGIWRRIAALVAVLFGGSEDSRFMVTSEPAIAGAMGRFSRAGYMRSGYAISLLWDDA